MKKVLLLTFTAVALLTTSVAAMAQNAIYRCGNEYLNNAALAASRACQLVEGVNVTVVPGTRVNRVDKEDVSPATASVPARSLRRSTGSNASPTTNPAAQRARDSDARSILLAELKTAETRLADQQKEYNNGEPEKLSTETRNPQRYQDRVNELKDGINRFRGDIAGLKREIARLPMTVAMPSLPAQSAQSVD
jgi:hypothetical protein